MNTTHTTDDPADNKLDPRLVRFRGKLLAAAQKLADDDLGVLNVKIAATALEELHDAFTTFSPYRHRRKVTIFGSARVADDGPLYRTTVDVSHELSRDGWMVVTGAGPGIMHAGFVGAGAENALGASIELPFEASEGVGIVGRDRVASMKYFFTRKLALNKESHAFIALPGGFGTQDEVFELLTLIQTGKMSPTPVVLLDAVGGTYWRRWESFLREELANGGFIDPDDLDLFHITNSPADAADHIRRFYANFDSCRFVGNKLIIRMHRDADDSFLADLNTRFADLLTAGCIERTQASRQELADGDRPDLFRLSLQPDRRKNALLRSFINALNEHP